MRGGATKTVVQCGTQNGSLGIRAPEDQMAKSTPPTPLKRE